MKVIQHENYNGRGISDSRTAGGIRFVNCTFSKCDLSGYSFTNCEFEDCVFTDCNFKRAFLALNKGKKSGKFIRCFFITCNLKETSFGFPVIEDCEFRNCKMAEVNFDGSRFVNTKFIGELNSCFFRGYSIYTPKFSWATFTLVDLIKLPNKMINVDFSQARLVGNLFTNRIDLSQCTFPSGEEYVYVNDLPGTMAQVLNEVKNEWIDEDQKEIAIHLIEDIYFNRNMQEQQNNFFDSFFAQEMDVIYKKNGGLNMRLFQLIKTFA